jgi:hypothetical protein
MGRGHLHSRQIQLRSAGDGAATARPFSWWPALVGSTPPFADPRRQFHHLVRVNFLFSLWFPGMLCEKRWFLFNFKSVPHPEPLFWPSGHPVPLSESDLKQSWITSRVFISAAWNNFSKQLQTILHLETQEFPKSKIGKHSKSPPGRDTGWQITD